VQKKKKPNIPGPWEKKPQAGGIAVGARSQPRMGDHFTVGFSLRGGGHPQIEEKGGDTDPPLIPKTNNQNREGGDTSGTKIKKEKTERPSSKKKI